MPGTPVTRHKLDQLPIATDEKMSRNPESFEGSIRGIILQFNAISEQTEHIIPAKLAWRQTDVVNHQQINGSAFRPGVLVG